MTPHLGEMSRLTGHPVKEIQKNLIKEAMDFAEKNDVVCVLKDFHTVTAISHRYTYLNMSGNNGMATAGSGDVLSGMIGALLAGDAAREKTSATSMMASDILQGITHVWIKQGLSE